jgi:hypothetical protein
MIEALLGGVFGGVLRLAPEVLKWLDKKNERAHELTMVQAEMEFAKVKAEVAMHEHNTQLASAELDAVVAGLNNQAEMAKDAGWFVSAVSALVRPIVTYLFAGAYVAVKAAAYYVAVSQGADWTVVVQQLWNPEDMGVLNMILTFWFVGRVYERSGK